MKKLFTLILILFVLIDVASSQVCNVPIKLTNSQNTATPDSFEQMIIVNSSLFSAVEMSGLQNIEFTIGAPAPTGTVLEAWIESGNSYLSDSTIYWVNLADSIIPANDSLVIYMDFMGTSVMSAGGPTGEAPDISTTYAQYDNGGLVFPHVYTRWGGLSSSSLPTAINGDAINGGDITSINQMGTMTITNQTTYTQVAWNNPSSNTSYPGNINGLYYSTTPGSSYNYPTVLESKADIGSSYSWFGTGYGQEEEGWGAVVANDNDDGSMPTYSVRSNFNISTCGSGIYSYQDWTTYSETSPVDEVWTIMLNYINDTDYITNEMHNYVSLQIQGGVKFPLPIDGSSAVVYQAPCSGGLGTLFGYFGTTQNSPDPQPYEQIYWTRTRAYPPGGIMPAAIVDTLNGSVGLVQLFPISDTICKGTQVTIAAAGGLAYTWSNGDTDSVIIVSPASTTTFTVTATTGCGTVSDTAIITVDTALQPLTILPPEPTLCGGQSDTLTASGATNYSWSPATGLSGTTGSSVVASPTVTTTYSIIGTSGNCTDTAQVIVDVFTPPNKPIITQLGDTLFSSARTSNQWYRNDSVITGATDSFLIIGNTTASYAVEVIDPANGCSNISNPLITSGINQIGLSHEQLSIYPNPTNDGLVYLKINSVNVLGELKIVVTDVLGRTLLVTTTSDYNSVIDLSKQSPDIYFISVINNNARTVIPIVKE